MRRLVTAAACVLVFGVCALPASAKHRPPAADGRIAFADEFQPVIWTIRPDGSDQQLLAALPTSPDYSAYVRGLSFSADGSRLAVMYEQVGTNTFCGAASAVCWSIVLMGGNGGTEHVVFSSGNIGSGSISLSSDGREVAFTLVVGDTEPLFTMGSDGRHLRQVTKPAQFQTDTGPSWSPDGKSLAFYSNRECCTEHLWSLYVVNAHNRHLRKLMPVGGTDLEVDWSPDGGRLLFLRTFDYPDYRIFSVGADGTGEQQLVADSQADENPQWAPGADRILYSGSAGLTVALANGGDPQVIHSPVLAYDWRPNF